MKLARPRWSFSSLLSISMAWGAVFFLPLAVCLGGCSQQEKKPGEGPAAPVFIATAVKKTVPLRLAAIGHVEAFATVAINSRVGGVLQKVHFKAGEEIRQGDLLFTIDPRPYQAALRQAEAALAKNLTQMKNAREESRRYRELFDKGYVSRQQYDQIRTAAEALEAQVQADRAQVEAARLALGYCTLYAPIEGRAGDLRLDEGNLIKAIDENRPLVTLHQIVPIQVRFAVPEKHLPDIQRYLKEGPLEIEVLPEPGTAAPLASGRLTFVDNSVDAATGVITLKGVFDNADKRLWPGQFVQVSLILARQPDAVTIPTQAIQAGQDGSFVYVVQPDLTVVSRPVEVHRTVGQESVIDAGVSAGEKVVVEGQMRLTSGARVKIREPLENGGGNRP